MKKVVVLLAILFFAKSLLFANVSKIDSLKTLIQSAKSDTDKVALQVKLFYYLYPENKEAGKNLYSSLNATIPKLNSKKHQIKSYYKLAEYLRRYGEYEKAELTASKCVKLAKTYTFEEYKSKAYQVISRIKLSQSQSYSAIPYLDSAIMFYNNTDEAYKAMLVSHLGRCYYDLGNYQKAMDYYIQSQKIFENNNIRNADYAHLMHFIGSVFKRQNIDNKAIEYYKKILEVAEEINEPYIEAEGLYLLGDMYAMAGNEETCDKYLRRALMIYTRENDIDGQALMLLNLAHGEVYNGELDSALAKLKEAERRLKEANYNGFTLTINRYLGDIYSQKGDYKKALEHLIIAKELAENQEEKRTLHLADIHKTTAYVHYTHNAFKDAFKELELHIKYQDSLITEENLNAIHEMEQRYDNQKKENEILTLNKDNEISKKELDRQLVMKNAFIGGFILMLLLAGSIFFSLKQNKKKNRIITIQKIEVEEKNREILDSINYAKRIQAAILPPDKLVKEYLQNSFIIYKPKDIVAGDFYWMEHKDDKIIFAAADCTGHGVPGAMVSVICNNGLNRAVREHGLTDPGKILDKAREIVVEEFAKSEDDVNDGMDIAICSLYKNTLEFAGANNPLWIVRNQEIIEYKGDKQPIGKFDNPIPYATHKIELQKGDTIYIFSDGYTDQFGGDKGKKFKAANFKELLLSVQKEDMQTQKEIIDKAFAEWKGNLEQIDDVCIIGVRV